MDRKQVSESLSTQAAALYAFIEAEADKIKSRVLDIKISELNRDHHQWQISRGELQHKGLLVSSIWPGIDPTEDMLHVELQQGET